MQVKSLVPVIEANYKNLSPVERRIADFFIENKEMSDFSAKFMAQKLFVSEASLSRFAKKCGYDGYREFIYLYEHSFQEEDSSSAKKQNTVLATYEELWKRTGNLVDEVQIGRICRYLSEAKRVFVCGRGSSGFAAGEMELRFMRIGVDINCILDSHRMKMQTAFLDKRNLVIGISISGRTPEILQMLKEGHRRGSRTVLLTANQYDDLYEFCDEVVLAASKEHLNEGNMISPQYPILLLTDILYSAFLHMEEDGKRKTKEILHDSTVQALEQK